MIKLLRVDDSFLYGNKGLQWVKATGARVIVLIDDGLRSDNFAQNLLQMACPASVKMIVQNVEEGREALRQHIRSREAVLVIVGSFFQLSELYPNLGGLNRVNVGSVRGNSSSELLALKKLRDQAMEFEIRDYPEETPVRLGPDRTSGEEI